MLAFWGCRPPPLNPLVANSSLSIRPSVRPLSIDRSPARSLVIIPPNSRGRRYKPGNTHSSYRPASAFLLLPTFAVSERFSAETPGRSHLKPRGEDPRPVPLTPHCVRALCNARPPLSCSSFAHPSPVGPLAFVRHLSLIQPHPPPPLAFFPLITAAASSAFRLLHFFHRCRHLAAAFAPWTTRLPPLLSLSLSHLAVRPLPASQPLFAPPNTNPTQPSVFRFWRLIYPSHSAYLFLDTIRLEYPRIGPF
ncbi:hypothetical protein CDV31_016313 [Fusarium ambrosium]|uniref:Uncharacterized protein n=1 Tax=Fusarium ambrosium TaxID=131363 RepID=A0A428SB90_9HYPO|nr:hypothetical protein CDV31_016313 [Fusarium ambrosium]